MKAKKLIFVMMLAVAMIITSMSSVHAASCGVNMSPDKTNLAEGYEVTITVSLSNIDAGEAGIYGLKGSLEYSTNVFEKLTSDSNGITTSMVALNGWGTPTFNSADNTFTILTTNPVKSGNPDIMQIKLKVKSGATLGRSIVMLNNLVASDGTNDIESTPVSISFNITEATGEDNNTVTPIIPSLNTNANTNANTNKNTNIITTNTGAASGKTPQTGITDYAVPVIFGALVISVISYVAYIRYKDV